MVESHAGGAVIQAVEVDGRQRFRVLMDKPLEQARRDGFPDAWPVRLCSGDLKVPPCSQIVAKQPSGDV